MYKLDAEESYGLTHEEKIELDPIANLSELKAHEIRRMPVYKDDQPSRVDVVGYVEPNKRIKQMIEAGIRIDAWNHALYDFENPDEEDDGFTMAEERDDIDDLEMLSAGARAREEYYRSMYDNYSRALQAQRQAENSTDVDNSLTRENGEKPTDVQKTAAKAAE